jgi:hypothetical protein
MLLATYIAYNTFSAQRDVITSSQIQENETKKAKHNFHERKCKFSKCALKQLLQKACVRSCRQLGISIYRAY